jgi:UDPglucose 6-dehydrogenase
MKITIFGSGYVGLVTGACLAQMGNDVLCVDIDQQRVDNLIKGIMPIHEPGLDQLVLDNSAAGRLSFTTDMAEAVAFATIQMIAVGTPPDEDGSADLSHVLAVARTIGEHMDDYRLVVTKSTVPVGTADKVRNAVSERLAGRNATIAFDVCSNPEFLKEGAAIDDFMKPDRIVVGTDSERATGLLRELYAPFNRSHERLLVMDVRSSELTKYAANAMLATKISFMNELANLAEMLDADIENIRIGIGSDPRIGYHFIYPGCGYGGSCFPKDVKALARTANEVGYQAQLLDAVEDVNDRQKQRMFEKINQHFDGGLQDKTFALWGLAFKPGTDDMREAPSRTLMEALWSAGARVQAHDPVAMDEARRIYGERGDLTLCETPELALEGADALVVVTEWTQFRSHDMALIADRLGDRVIFDGRNIYDPKQVHAHGLHYYGIGRSSAAGS